MHGDFNKPHQVLHQQHFAKKIWTRRFLSIHYVKLRLFFVLKVLGAANSTSRNLVNNLPSHHVCSWRKILKRHGTLSMDCCYLHCSDRLTMECWAALTLQQGLMLCRVPPKILHKNPGYMRKVILVNHKPKNLHIY